MSQHKVLAVALSTLLAASLSVRAAAQCLSYDFENLAVGTAVTNQYDGVTFSVVGQSCGGSPTLYLRIANTFLGDAFGSKVLLIDNGCPDFSPDYVRMVFDLPQSHVSFTLGPWYGTYAVRAYSTVSGGSPISTQDITIPGSGFTSCHRLVDVISATGNIRRIEIQETMGLWEAIDDLAFGADDTPPTVEITSPTALSCVCGSVLVTGVACDEDGAYDSDRLEYLRVYPAGGSTWTLISQASTPVCTPGSLYIWNTAGAGITEGLYMLRITATNACGLSSSAVTTVNVDKDFDVVTIRQPATGAILGGNICLDGTAWDEFCFDSYVVEYQPAAGGAWQPVDPTNPIYTASVVVDPLATWVTTLGSPADGNYNLRVIGETHCGNTATQTVTVTVDNTPPIAQIQTPAACTRVNGTVSIKGTASDAHINQWQLDYYQPTTRTWQHIASGAASINNALLGNWNTAGLPTCYYTLRLRVTDNAIVNNCGNADPHVTEDYLAVAVGPGPTGCTGDTNGDGRVTFADIDPFVALIGRTCP